MITLDNSELINRIKQTIKIKKILKFIKIPAFDRYQLLTKFDFFIRPIRKRSKELLLINKYPHLYFFSYIKNKRKCHKYFNKMINDRKLPQLTERNKNIFFALLFDYELYLTKNNLLVREHKRYSFPDYIDIIYIFQKTVQKVINAQDIINILPDYYKDQEDNIYPIKDENYNITEEFIEHKFKAFHKLQRIYLFMKNLKQIDHIYGIKTKRQKNLKNLKK